MDESKTSLVSATIEYQPYENRELTPEKIELIRKILDSSLTDEEWKAVNDKAVEILYRRNDITNWCRVVDLTEDK